MATMPVAAVHSEDLKLCASAEPCVLVHPGGASQAINANTRLITSLTQCSPSCPTQCSPPCLTHFSPPCQ